MAAYSGAKVWAVGATVMALSAVAMLVDQHRHVVGLVKAVFLPSVTEPISSRLSYLKHSQVCSLAIGSSSDIVNERLYQRKKETTSKGSEN